MKTRLLCLVSIVLLTTSCFLNNDDYDESQDMLLAITQIGANTFGALVNGSVVIPKDGYQGFGASYNPLSTTVYNGSPLEIESRNLSEGMYNIDGGSNIGFESDITTSEIYYRDKKKRYLSLKDSGSIIVTRYDSGILSGTFSFKAVNKDNPEDVIEVTEGRFDINLDTVNLRGDDKSDETANL